MIAFIFMLCDHIGYVLIENGVLYGQNPMYWNLALQTAAGQRWYLAARILRFIGRLSFPIFAFLAAEGFAHTGNRRRYIMRLALFALISEVPFDLAIKHTVWYPDYQNVMFTLLFGVLALCTVDKLRKRHIIFQMLAVAFFCWAAYIAKSDYGPVGVLLTASMYMFRLDRKLCIITGAFISALESLTYSGVGALAYVFIWLYNGKRGEMPMKYFFYIGYPAHLLLFYAMVYFANR